MNIKSRKKKLYISLSLVTEEYEEKYEERQSVEGRKKMKSKAERRKKTSIREMLGVQFTVFQFITLKF